MVMCMYNCCSTQLQTLTSQLISSKLWVTTYKVTNIMEAGWDTGMEQACSRCSPSLVVRPFHMQRDLGVLSIMILTHGVRTFLNWNCGVHNCTTCKGHFEYRQTSCHSKFSTFQADILTFSVLEVMCYLLVHIVAWTSLVARACAFVACSTKFMQKPPSMLPYDAWCTLCHYHSTGINDIIDELAV